MHNIFTASNCLKTYTQCFSHVFYKQCVLRYREECTVHSEPLHDLLIFWAMREPHQYLTYNLLLEFSFLDVVFVDKKHIYSTTTRAGNWIAINRHYTSPVPLKLLNGFQKKIENYRNRTYKVCKAASVTFDIFVQESLGIGSTRFIPH